VKQRSRCAYGQRIEKRWKTDIVSDLDEDSYKGTVRCFTSGPKVFSTKTFPSVRQIPVDKLDAAPPAGRDLRHSAPDTCHRSRSWSGRNSATDAEPAHAPRASEDYAFQSFSDRDLICASTALKNSGSRDVDVGDSVQTADLEIPLPRKLGLSAWSFLRESLWYSFVRIALLDARKRGLAERGFDRHHGPGVDLRGRRRIAEQLEHTLEMLQVLLACLLAFASVLT